MLPFIGRFPVNSQIFDITISFEKEPVKLPVNATVARIIYAKFARAISLAWFFASHSGMGCGLAGPNSSGPEKKGGQ
jgi:hypothetical protein